METSDRPHFRTTSATATSELFVCFTSRISSSSSMKISKSILSPGRAARDGGGGGGPVSLSSSLSRRLRTNGSLKGGASPFLSSTGRKRGCTFDNPEPSSPKVTCIGQVRVKTKKKVKQRRSLSKRGEVSFRKVEQQGCGEGDDKECLAQRNQRWVHLPMSICEALREFSCLFPCRSSTSEGGRERSEKQSDNENGCGAVLARWVVSVNESEAAKGREIELVVGGGDEEEEEEEERHSFRTSRRHVFKDIEVKDDRIELKGQSLEGEGGRLSICIPPKNALLLMRCRSDPIKMAALSNTRFTPQNQHIQEQHYHHHQLDEDEEQEEEEVRIGGKEEAEEEEEGTVNFEQVVFEQEIVSEKELTNEVEDDVKLEIEGDEEEIEEESSRIMSDEEKPELEILLLEEEEEKEEEGMVEKDGSEEEEVESNMSSFEALLDEDFCPLQDAEEEEQVDEDASVSPSTESDEEPLQQSMDKVEPEQKEDENNQADEEEEEEKQEAEPEEKKEKEVALLPECLVLMMREPKLSMEVSRETWVCSTDFMRKAVPEPLKRRLSIDSKPKPQPPPPMATIIEQKLVNAVAYEPFVLTRCKSEPMRTAAAKLIPESCFWKNAAAKPHTMGVGAAEVGF